jgi:hypothetical protein
VTNVDVDDREEKDDDTTTVANSGDDDDEVVSVATRDGVYAAAAIVKGEEK